jgi:eukaryotic-like serine/threonine-protein kinase
MPLVAGSRLDSYEIIAPLGAGGMGEVYRARDGTLKRDVAIKVLPESWSRDPERLRRFEQEAQATAALNHPNIVSIFHVGQYAGSPYIVTELLQGETLRDRLRKGPMRLQEVLDFGGEIARGLAAAHDAGIVHRDLKPENIWVTKDGRIKILDFGLAKLDPAKAASPDGATVTIQQHTSPGHVLGTVGYMSPEQVRGQTADARSDIFAVGAILYEMLTGKLAFHKATSAETMTAILHDDPAAISQVAPSVPPGLQRTVNRCLAKGQEQRIQHATDLAFALESLSDFGGTTVRPFENRSIPKRTTTWVLLAALIAMGFALAYWWSRPPGVPVVEAITQITDDGKAKGVHNSIQTDGSRLYFNEGRTGTLEIAQASVTGGPISLIPTPLRDPQPVGIAPDGSALLVLPGGAGPPAKPAWKVPLPAGDPIRLGNLEGQDVSTTPDGHILISKWGDLYIAEKDGSNPRKILSAGLIGDLSMSPDGKRIVYTEYKGIPELWEANSDGTGIRMIAKNDEDGGFCCAKWTPDGRYIVFETRAKAIQDLWYMPMQGGWLQAASKPGKLTAGPISYHDAVPSRDGKSIFAIGTKERGELVRYDAKSKQFVAFLGGISATNVSFSRDGNWVTYFTFPERVLWRSRSDGTERLQLASPPHGWRAVISPDGKQVAYENDGNIELIGIDGGQPQAVVNDGKSWAPDWSPDGNLILFATRDGDHHYTSLFDLRTGKKSVVPGADELNGARWIGDEKLLSVWEDVTVFDMKTQTKTKWEFEPKFEGNSAVGISPDHQYLYYTLGEPDPAVWRVRLGEHKGEKVASLKDFHSTFYIQLHGAGRIVDVAPDGSPVFTRDTGSQEIYALTVKWP